MEIMNIAVAEHLQAKRDWEEAIKACCRKQGYGSKLEVGTGNSSVSQLALYQNVDFVFFY